MLKPGILSSDEFQTIINYFVPDILIEETEIPFHAVATDLVSGEQITFSSGSLRQAVRASCAVPGAVEPLQYGDMILSDGGIISLIPITVARKKGAENISLCFFRSCAVTAPGGPVGGQRHKGHPGSPCRDQGDRRKSRGAAS